MSRSVRSLVFAALVLCLSASCSNTRVLSEGQYRLKSNKVEFNGDPNGLSGNDVSSYIKQQTSNPFILGWIYNWSDPKKDDWLNNSLRKVGVAPVVFNPGLLKGSCENIGRHLDYLGYYHSKVSTKVDTLGKNVKVTYTVTPGKRSRIDSIVYKVPEGEFYKEFKADRRNFLVKDGDWLSEKVLEKESERGASYFRNKGYYDLTKFNYFFEADTLGPRNILTYEIREYTRNEPETNAEPLVKYHIGKVDVSLSQYVPFREDILRKVNIIRPGDTYSEKLVNANYNRYSALRLFNNVAIEMTPVDSATVDCHITLGQGKLKGIKVNLEASTNSNSLWGISPAISFYNKNIFHGGEWLSLGFSGNFQRQFDTNVQANEFGVTGNLSFPSFLTLPYTVFRGGSIPRTVIQGSFHYQNRPEFMRYIGNLSYGYSGSSDKLFFQIYPLKATVVKVGHMTDEFIMSLLKNVALYDSFYDHLDAGSGGQLYWTTDASVIPKNSYTYARFSIDASGNFISLFDKWIPENSYGEKRIFGLAYSRYFKAEVDFGHTFRFSPGTALAMRITGGAARAVRKDEAPPFEKQFYVGGANSMRGWQVRALGPGASPLMSFFTIASQVGESKLEFDMELRQKLFWKIEGAVFAEVGNIWDFNGPNPEWLNTFAGDWGLGIRLNLDFILLRLDWGLKVYEPSRDAGSRWLTPLEWVSKNGSALHFGVGYPF